MAANSQFIDAVELEDLRLPYDPFTKTLSRQPRLVAGSNVYPSRRGRLRKRGGVGGSGDLTGETVPGRIDRLGVYQTVEPTAKVYLLASVYDGTDWEMFWLRLDASVPAWTSMGSLRGLNASRQAHEWIVARGKVYIRAFPATGVDKLGSVVFDGTDATTHFWGLLGPAQPARITSSAGWSASNDPVTVRVGWTYVYTWKTSTGHESPRSDLEFDPSQNASTTGAFTGKLPVVTVRGHADTTHVTHVVIYRTSDGGGRFLKLAEVTNPGDSNFTYTDDDLDGMNPIPDAKLDVLNKAPTLVSNTPPPTVTPPGIAGTTEIDLAASNVVYWQERIWFAIRERLYFSGQEEIRKGVPEECFPAGDLSGNNFRFQSKVTQLIPTQEVLYIVTQMGVLGMVGRFRDSFRPETVVETIGGAEGHTHAWAAIENQVFWLTHDFQIAAAAGRQVQIISESLDNDIRAEIGANREYEFAPYMEPGISWLVVLAKHKTTPSSSKQWTLNLREAIWSPPWTGPLATSVAYGPSRESDRTPLLLFGLWASGSPGTAVAGAYTGNVFTNFVPGGSPANTAFSMETNLFPIPVGNQLNAVGRAGHTANFAGFKLEWISGVTEPTVAFALDDSSGTVTTVTSEDLTLRDASVGYVTKQYSVEEMAERVKLKISRTADAQGFDLETVAFLWQISQGG